MNDKKYLKDCLSSLFSQDYPKLEVIVVDNCSSDGGPKFVEEFFSLARVIRAKRNLGYAAGNNLGFRHARGDFIFILNPDTIVAENAVSLLVENARKVDPGILMPVILLHGQKNRINTDGNRLCYVGISWVGNYGKRLETKDQNPREIFLPSGAAMFLSRDIFDQLGGFDNGFFMYLEDADLGIRARLMQYKIWVVAQAIVFHKYQFAKSPSKFINYEKNRLMLLFKSFSAQTLLILSPILMLMEGAMLLYFASKRNLGAKIQTYAFLLSNLSRIRKKRKLIQQSRHIPDSVLFRWLDLEIKFPELSSPLVTGILNRILHSYGRLAYRAIGGKQIKELA